MKKFCLVLLTLMLTAFSAFSQGMQEPVKWTFTVVRNSPTEAELQLKADIKDQWHLYSQNTKGLELPIVFEFVPSANYQLVGKVTEPKPQSHFDSIAMDYSRYFYKKVTFKQKIKITNPNKIFKIKGKISGQACIEGRCTQVEKEIDITIDAVIADGENVDSSDLVSADTTALNSDTLSIKLQNSQITESKTQNDDAKEEDSMLLFFLTSILSGLLGLLMPCVFPMIPMTVSYFMKSGKKGKFNALFYGISIVVIFVLFGIILSAVMGPDFANVLSTHWIPNVLFAAIFIVFAISLFGYFEIALPSKWVNKSSKMESRGGLVGVFFMALTLVLVSFSCTLPIAGAVALNAAGGSFIKPIIGMLGFSLGIAVPFTLFALFPNLLKSMPKSGGWMNTLKVILAFVELAFALKFLNVPDQTYGWGILDREVYLAFWIVIFTLLGLYLIGKIRFPADAEMPVQKSWIRFIISIFTFTFVVYMIPGMWGAPLKAISGWLPPMETQDFNISEIVRKETKFVLSPNSENAKEEPKYADQLHFPNGIEGYFDYDQALRVAKKMNKPIFVDFTGHGCTNCRKVENTVWIADAVREKFTNDFVLLAMYVDDKKVKLDKEDYIVDNDGKTLTMLGEKNTFISNQKYKENSQPCYYIIDYDGSVLVGPTYYELDIQKYLQFMDQGIEAFKKKHGN